MNYINLFSGTLLFLMCHILVWFNTNTQFMNHEIKDKSFLVAIILSVPTTICAYYASRVTYDALDSTAWAVRFMAFGTSWIVFPLMTWLFLNESMMTPKTMVCTFLAICIICVQLWWPTNI